MKNYFKPLIIIMSAAFIISCSADDLEKFTTVTINAELENDFNVSIGAEDQANFTHSQTFDATTNGDIKKFETRIDSYQVDSLTLGISSVMGAESINIIDLSVTIKDASGTNLINPLSIVPSTTFPSINLNEFDSTNGIITLIFDDNAGQIIANALKSDNEISVEITGEIDGAPVDFTINSILYLQVSGSVVN